LRVTVTHPHHPLHGQLVAVIRIRRGPDPDLIIRFPDGFFGAISASWTDYAAGPDSELSSPPPPLLDPFGLCRVAQLIDQLREHCLLDDPSSRSKDDPRYAENAHPCPSAN
jgi:Family of unknown function (DUF5372)